MSVHEPNYEVNTDMIIDVNPQPKNRGQQSSTNVVSLTTQQGTISQFLAPLTKETFKQVVQEVEQKLQVVNQTLSMLDYQGFEAILQEMLHSITLKTGELLGADRTTIFLLDEEQQELWSILAEGKNKSPLEIRIPANKGIAGEVASFKRVVNIPFDFYDDPRSAVAQEQDKRNGYRTYTMLALPLLNTDDKLVAVVQLLNKLKPIHDIDSPLNERIDNNGFTEFDENLFLEFAPSIRLILESSRSFYIATQKQRAAAALMKAIKSLSQSGLDLEDTLKRVMNEAKELMNADRSTLWLIDRDRHDLWTKIYQADGIAKELRVPMGQGFVGIVAATGKKLNIPFDLYQHSDSGTAQKIDQSNGYRTCSLLCMPIFNRDQELIGVTQLVNKKKVGDFPAYNPNSWPNAPDCFQASFDKNDEEFMEAFNIQAGVALQNAQLFAKVKQQEKMQRDILRSLSNGVISTDQNGVIITANESAKELLGFGLEEALEGKMVSDIVAIREGDFSKWFQNTLQSNNSKDSQQYYPDRTLLTTGTEQHSVNLSLNSIADVQDENKVCGALVVMEDISDEKRLKSTMYRYMTQELAEELLKLDDAKLGGDRKEVTILFSDIRGYTTLTENMEAEEVVRMLNEYFESMVDAVFKHKGTLDKYIGDAIMAVFGSPLPLADHAIMAVQTSLEMRGRLQELNELRKTTNECAIKIGVGINSDTVISGNIGSSKRMEFTAIGDGVNLGSRLESVSKQYGCDIIISDNTYKICQDSVWARELDYIRVKGRNEPVAIYELVGLRNDTINSAKLEVIEHYHKGREYYLKRQFTSALSEFVRALSADNQDKASMLYMSRCQHWLQSPPSNADWDEGVWTFKEK
ncbi:GAF domain-containing protein [Dolichospermum sp. LEGE 00240]|jgi:adenylate cyclase|uniref:GAF domain-containing protein n=1 Tax=Dolichospermum sp. LEGE 00240 TaxID=1828603 RepID=UPI0018811262|nr:adenylate/guanylate cyclase domain-containing protein [Dolichospermum sp. LEGE 00240]MDM3848267.1 adenylate/guanylate cyclase domain-containing protein [Aphanizomenon gracile PMC638.10]MDM3849832.1 adenylate/guanylate cyclase domain-containing protein [Aphanizomenon gracile PMC627.10]MDM3854399.1 adenylate/guanylate cyclase domain-containing protein [Aphanizomenon gracile PMC649.10]MDM3861241.1 adenylate/guanylate cyclase domain-containing protein [Aphanizomenon gracile PMC644.10]MBE9251468